MPNIQIIRNQNSNYKAINNTILRDKRVSLKARGLFITIMGLPNDWDFSMRGMISILQEGKAAIYAAMNELIELGYCSREQIRDNGKLASTIYYFNEEPGLPYTDNQYTGKPYTGNPPQYEEEELRIKNKKEEETNNMPSSRKSANFDQVVEIFDYWKTALNHPRSILDQKRKRSIETRLKEGYSAEELKQAIRGVKQSAHHMGANEGGVIYDDITLICRDATHVEKFMALDFLPVKKMHASDTTHEIKVINGKEIDLTALKEKFDKNMKEFYET